jgi:peptidoglycan/xylan/chitin deacetylase (PgdA/CDA1 family)
VILYGHRVTGNDEGYLPGLAPEHFEEQLVYLTRHYSFLSLSDLVGRLREGRPVPPMSAVLTLDDGFRDNYTNAFPVLRRLGIPATVFLTTGCVSEGTLPWSQRLGYLLQTTRVTEIQDPATGQRLSLAESGLRREAYAVLKTGLRSLPAARRDELMDRFARHLEVTPPTDRMLTWDQIAEMARGGVAFGAHTATHPMLAEIPWQEARTEMERSLSDVREHLGVDAPPFAFPAGSCSDALVDLAREVGFSSVFRRRRESRVNNAATATPFSLCRVGLPVGPAYLLEAELDGPFETIRRAYRR